MFDPNRICLGCMEELKNGDAVCPKCGWNNAVNNNVSHQLLAGSVLMGKYLVGRVLGEGGFGITYIGWDLILDRKVAIKEFYPQGIVNRELTHHSTVVSCIGKEEFIEKEKEGFIKEAKTMAKLGNIPGIVTMHDVFAQNGTVYIVMDYVEGKTLKAYVKENGNRLSAKTAISLLEPIFGALQKIHEKGLIHRDISPDNIMLRPDGTAVLLDFGAARQMSVAGERSLTVNLKHGYAPMEQYQTRGVQGPWTDVYALSATIYRLITGRVPPSAADRIIEDDLPLPSTLGSDILPRQEEALMKGLAIRTADRTLNISELWEGLAQAPAEKAPQKQPQEEPAEENKTGEPQHIPAQQQTEESHTGEEFPIEHRAEQTEPPKEPSAEERQEPEEKEQPKTDKVKSIKLLAAVLAIASVFIFAYPIYNAINYEKGIALFESEKYAEAFERLCVVREYKDAEDYIEKIDEKYTGALNDYNMGYYNAALVELVRLDGYKYAGDYIVPCRTNVAYWYLEEMELDKAIEQLEKLEHYECAIAFLKEYSLNAGDRQTFYSADKAKSAYTSALASAYSMGAYSGFESDNLKETVYHIAVGAMRRGEYFFSRALFEDKLKNYSDSEEMVQSIDDAMMEYVNEHQSADDFLTYQYLFLITWDGGSKNYEQANKIYYKLYGKFAVLYGNENTVWGLTENGTLTVMGNGKLSDCYFTQSEKDATKKIVINEGITELGSLSFHGFDKVKSIKIPSTVKYISDDAFDESVISKIKIDKNNKYYTVENGKLVRIDG